LLFFEMLELEYGGNTVRTWIATVLVLFGMVGLTFSVLRVLIRQMEKISKRTETQIDDLALEILKKTRFYLVLVICIYASSTFLTLPLKVTGILSKISVTGLIVQCAIWLHEITTFWLNHFSRKNGYSDEVVSASFSIVTFLSRLIIWSIALVLILDNLGVNITALVAGLGVGGIAIGLAVQNILGDLFGSLSIVLDKPFVVGDFIVIESFQGTVERVGLKTTRLRSISGEQIIFSNNDLLKSRIRNFKRMYERRVVFSLGIVYQTPVSQVEKIPEIICNIIQAQEKVRFERTHLKGFGASSLDFECVYYVLDADYTFFMNIQHRVNLAIMKAFEAEKIEFAYPTQTLYLQPLTAPHRE
jgi:small-conductance mechanosensitive channel